MDSFWILLAFAVSISEAAECGVNTDTISCNGNAKYRTFDGSCNNLQNTHFGIANSLYDRLLPAKYGDGNHTIANSVTGKPLPNARFLSEYFFIDLPNSETRLTNLIVGALQFVAHDLSFGKTGGPSKQCCTEHFQMPKEVPPTCQNIKVPPNDPVYSEYKADCIPLVTTQSNYCPSKDLNTKQAQQISSVTHWLDLSVIYGNSNQQNKALRTGSGGLLKMEERSGQQYLPNSADQSLCTIPKNNHEVCYKTGDVRANQSPYLSVHTIMWVRAHNNVARFFQKLNPCWNDEKIFQEARAVVIAQHQWITFNEMLPLILGRQNMYSKNLLYAQKGYIDDYDDKCSPNVLNEMAQAAFRGLHVLIKGNLILAAEHRLVYDAIHLRDHMDRPQVVEAYDNFDSLIRGMSLQMPRRVNIFHDKEITQQISMQHSRVGTDLKAVDIHRARIHGLPSYNDMRSYCGLKKAITFDDFKDAMLPERVKTLQSAYSHPDDVDLTLGGQLETPHGDSMVGPTFQCIFMKQLKRTRKCDRFWFENRAAGFTLEQLEEIKKQTMATFVCDNSNNIEAMQPHAFESISKTNELKPCKTQPRWNLGKWKDPKCHI